MTLGIPYLRNDLFRYESRLRQKLFSRQVSLDLRYRHDRDNLIDSTRSTTETDMLGLGQAITPRKLTFLRVNVTPYWQKDNAVGEFQLDNTILVVAAWIATQMVNIGTNLTITGTGSMSVPTSVHDSLRN